MMHTNIRKREKCSNLQSAIYLGTLIPQTPSNHNKRFSRRRQNSNQSINRSRQSSIGKLLHSERDSELKQKKICHLNETTKTLPQKNTVMTLIKSTAYIKPHQHQKNVSIGQLDSMYYDSRQKLSNIKMAIQDEQTSNQYSYKFNNSNTRKLKIKPSLTYTQLSQYKQEGQSDSQDHQQSKQNTTSKQKLSKTNKKPTYYHKNQMMTPQAKKISHFDLQFQLEVKSKQLMIFEDENYRLKNQLGNCKKVIGDLNEEVIQLRKYNSELKKQVQEASTQVMKLLGKYSLNSISNEQKQNEEITQRLPALIKSVLSETIRQNINKKDQSHENLLYELKVQLSKQQKTISNLSMKTSFYERFKQQNKQFRCLNKKLYEEMEHIRKRNIYLKEESNTLRVSIATIRKTVIQLKNINKQKDRQLRIRKTNTYSNSYTQRNNKQFEFSFEKQIGISYCNSIVNNGVTITNMSNMNKSSSLATLKTNIVNKNDGFGLMDSENQNNLSFDISNVSTQQLMEMDDLV